MKQFSWRKAFVFASLLALGVLLIGVATAYIGWWAKMSPLAK
jgi:hypothetical protein